MRLTAKAALLALAALPLGCAREEAPTTFALPGAALARIRLVCPAGGGGDAAPANCARLPRRIAPPQ